MEFLICLFHALISFVIYSLIHDLLIKILYCKWKKSVNNGYKCYYWTCKYYDKCSFNGVKKRSLFKLFKQKD